MGHGLLSLSPVEDNSVVHTVNRHVTTSHNLHFGRLVFTYGYGARIKTNGGCFYGLGQYPSGNNKNQTSNNKTEIVLHGTKIAYTKYKCLPPKGQALSVVFPRYKLVGPVVYHNTYILNINRTIVVNISLLSGSSCTPVEN